MRCRWWPRRREESGGFVRESGQRLPGMPKGSQNLIERGAFARIRGSSREHESQIPAVALQIALEGGPCRWGEVQLGAMRIFGVAYGDHVAAQGHLHTVAVSAAVRTLLPRRGSAHQLP